MKCPTCPDQDLNEKVVEGAALLHCDRCDGFFLRQGELNRITHPKQGEDVEYSSVEELDPERKSGRDCPLCGPGHEMLKVNFVTYSAIEMEYCPDCRGMWLESGELEQIEREMDKIENSPDTWERAFMVFLSRLPF